jgi:DHA2 family multidrug resistance protein-like MFS transporter
MAMMALFITGIDSLGAAPARAAGLIAAALGLCALLARRARGQPAPLVPVDLLRIKPLAFAAGASVCTFMASTAAYVAAPFYFEQVLGRPHLEVGMLVAAWPAGTVLMAAAAGWLADRHSAALLAGAGAGVMMLGLLALAALPLSASNAAIMVCVFTVGMGFGLFQAPNNRALLSSAPRARSGAIGGVQATMRVLGQSMGTACAGVAFHLAPKHGAVAAILLAAVCAAAAVAVNVARSAKLTS